MKFNIKKLTLTAIACILLSNTATFTANATEEKPVKTYKILPFRKIRINGNVEVTLVQKPALGISYTDDNEGSVKVIQQGEVLNITGSSTTSAKLLVYVNDLYRIEADDDAKVKTDGILSTKYLQIILKGNAYADIYSKSEELYTSIGDKSALRLRGKTDAHFLYMDRAPNLTLDQFAALRTQAANR